MEYSVDDLISMLNYVYNKNNDFYDSYIALDDIENLLYCLNERKKEIRKEIKNVKSNCISRENPRN